MRKLNSNHKLCIYLDQYVVSNLIECPNSLWGDIKGILETKYANNKIYCPLSIPHFLETVKKRFENAKVHDEYFRTLSDNFIFKEEPFITSQLISSLIRNNNKTINTYLERRELNDIDSFYVSLNKKNEIFNEGIGSATALTNEIRKSSSNKIEKGIEDRLYETIKLISIEKIIKRLEEYLKSGEMRIRAETIGTFSFPNWIDQLLYQLTEKHKFNESLFQQLLTEIKLNGVKNIPTLDIRFSLISHIGVKQKQETVNDHIDVMRISNGLLSSDILFTDKKRKHEIQELKLDKLYKTIVFSGVESDLLEFKGFIEKV